VSNINSDATGVDIIAKARFVKSLTYTSNSLDCILLWWWI